MKLNRKKLRILIESVMSESWGDVNDPWNQEADTALVQKDLKRNTQEAEDKLRNFHQLSMKIRSIYDHHWSWNRGEDEKNVLDAIYRVREELYSLGYTPNELNTIKDMDYDEFDLYITK